MSRGFVAAVAFGVAGTGVLLALGVWQLDRLEWKEALIARLEARLAAAPAPLPAAPDPDADNFLRVRAEGRTGAEALHVLTTERPWGPGFRVVVPLTIEGAGEERTVMADLGYIPAERKGEGLGQDTAVTVTGALFWPSDADAFAPTPDREENIWFARRPDEMAAALGAEPVLIVADSHDLGEWPRPMRLGVNRRNDHLGYAITWFALAVIWAVMSVALARRERRRPAAG